MDSFHNKIITFATALQDMYKDSEEREATALPKLEVGLDEKQELDMTEDFTAMIYAVWGLYMGMIDPDVEPLEFSHLVNKLIVKEIIDSEYQEKSANKDVKGDSQEDEE